MSLWLCRSCVSDTNYSQRLLKLRLNSATATPVIKRQEVQQTRQVTLLPPVPGWQPCLLGCGLCLWQGGVGTEMSAEGRCPLSGTHLSHLAASSCWLTHHRSSQAPPSPQGGADALTGTWASPALLATQSAIPGSAEAPANMVQREPQCHSTCFCCEASPGMRKPDRSVHLSQLRASVGVRESPVQCCYLPAQSHVIQPQAHAAAPQGMHPLQPGF